MIPYLFTWHRSHACGYVTFPGLSWAGDSVGQASRSASLCSRGCFCLTSGVRGPLPLSYCLVFGDLQGENGVSFWLTWIRLRQEAAGKLSCHGHWLYCKAQRTAKSGCFSFCKSPLEGWRKRKTNQTVCSLAPGSIICLLLSAFSYLSLKSRGPKQLATDVLVQSAWYVNSVSMQIVILGAISGDCRKHSRPTLQHR